MPPTPEPVLVACAHGTRDPRGRRAVGSLLAALHQARGAGRVRAAFVDVHPPAPDDVVREVVEAGGTAVVVPLLLSAGYHVGVDVARAVHDRPAVAAAAMGPDARVTAVLLDRLEEAGVTDDDAVVLAAAGSSDPSAGADVEAVARDVAATRAGPLVVGYGASAAPAVADSVGALRAAHPGVRVALAAYLLAPGHFHTRLHTAGADLVSAPLLLPHGAPDPRLVAVVLDRYAAAAATLTA